MITFPKEKFEEFVNLGFKIADMALALNVCKATVVRNLRFYGMSAKKPMSVCVGCGKVLQFRRRVYCSNKCQRSSEWNERVKEIEEKGDIPHGNRVIRRYLLERNGNVCSICSGTTWMGKPMPLEVDHIDGNSENHSISNVRLVCGNCGMQLPTYKGKNRGSGRHWRKMRYQQGLSY